ncbi:MAG: SAM-dependent methyltransferase [Rhizobiales bacterium]|nr:SAM-dependent methyltransferase [Hyphomicrobiales bacterium]
MTVLGEIIAGMIREDGPMAIDRYMSLCLGHPQHGYYITRDPLGAAGDFTTSPEISQVFGELIGVWVAQVWQSMGSPRRFALIELGPGRGTLMADILRVLAKVDACAKAAEVHLVETSPALRAAQQARVPQATWHHTLASLPALPSIIVANEFFDALPIRQFERRGHSVFERVVGLSGDRLELGLVPSPMEVRIRGEGVFEDQTIRAAVAREMADQVTRLGGAALVIDYGHARTALGDTLQAMYRHSHVAVTDRPGEADITSHVDFEALGRACLVENAVVAGLMTQGDFLNAMGLEARTEVLARSVTGDTRTQLVAASERLAHHDQMGHLFKVMAVTSAGLALPYPFGAR